jgi:hypothetical protein
MNQHFSFSTTNREAEHYETSGQKRHATNFFFCSVAQHIEQFRNSCCIDTVTVARHLPTKKELLQVSLAVNDFVHSYIDFVFHNTPAFRVSG